MIKHNGKSLDKVCENICRVSDYLAKLSELQSSDKEVFWKALKDIISKQKKGHTEKLLALINGKQIDHPGTVLSEIKFIGGYIECYDEVLNLVGNNQELIDEAVVRLKELKATKQNIEDNIEAQ